MVYTIGIIRLIKKQMSDYEKIKAFAGELNPGGVLNCPQSRCFKGPGGADIVYYKVDGGIVIRGRNESVGAITSNSNIYPVLMTLDQWIKDTREYWREKGLPSLQNQYCRGIGHYKAVGWTNCQCGLIRNAKPKASKGKLYEMPNTVVHLKTQEEYDEYMQMCEDVGWTWHNGDKPTGYDMFGTYNYIDVKNKFCQGSFGYDKEVITLKELKERIGVQPTGQKLPIDTQVEVGTTLGMGTSFRKALLESYALNWQGQANDLIETREYWKKQGLPSLQGKRNNNLIIDDLSPMDWSKIEQTANHSVYHRTLAKLAANQFINKTNKKSIMKNIKDTLKALTHSKDDKALIKADLKNDNAEWREEVRQLALDQIVDERMATKEFKDQMLKVAEERNKECN